MLDCAYAKNNTTIYAPRKAFKFQTERCLYTRSEVEGMTLCTEMPEPIGKRRFSRLPPGRGRVAASSTACKGATLADSRLPK